MAMSSRRQPAKLRERTGNLNEARIDRGARYGAEGAPDPAPPAELGPRDGRDRDVRGARRTREDPRAPGRLPQAQRTGAPPCRTVGGAAARSRWRGAGLPQRQGPRNPRGGYTRWAPE